MIFQFFLQFSPVGGGYWMSWFTGICILFTCTGTPNKLFNIPIFFPKMLDELLASSSTDDNSSCDNSSLPDSPSEPMETEECIPSDAESSDAVREKLQQLTL